MNFIQYVGDNDSVKIFVDISNSYYPDGKGSFTSMLKGEMIIKPIDPIKYSEMVKHQPVSGRMEVEEINDVFIATEAHRDAYAFHLPGYLKIKELVIGDIIPGNGFKTSDFLSETDKKLIAKETTVMKILKARLAVINSKKNLTPRKEEADIKTDCTTVQEAIEYIDGLTL